MQMRFTRLLTRNRAIAMYRESRRGETCLTGYPANFRFNGPSLPTVSHRSSSRRRLRERDRCRSYPDGTRWKRVRRLVPRVEKMHLWSIKARRVTTRSRAKVDTDVGTALYEPRQYHVGVDWNDVVSH